MSSFTTFTVTFGAGKSIGVENIYMVGAIKSLLMSKNDRGCESVRVKESPLSEWCHH